MTKSFKKISRSVSALLQSGGSVTPKAIIEDAFVYCFSPEKGVTASHSPERFLPVLSDVCFKYARYNTGTSSIKVEKEFVKESDIFNGASYCSLLTVPDFLGCSDVPDLVFSTKSSHSKLISPLPISRFLSEIGNFYDGCYNFWAFDFNKQTIFLKPGLKIDFCLIYKPQFLMPDGEDDEEIMEKEFADFVSNDFLVSLPLLLSRELNITLGNNSWTSAMEEELKRLLENCLKRDNTDINFYEKSEKRLIFK